MNTDIESDNELISLDDDQVQSLKAFINADKVFFITYGYFSMLELMCKCCKKVRFHELFLTELTYLRHKFKEPMIVNSCCRCVEHNTNEDGHPRSLHLMDNPYHPTKGTMAIDISTNGWDEYKKNRFIDLAINLGWSIGYGSTFFHIDRRVDIGLERKEFNY